MELVKELLAETYCTILLLLFYFEESIYTVSIAVHTVSSVFPSRLSFQH